MKASWARAGAGEPADFDDFIFGGFAPSGAAFFERWGKIGEWFILGQEPPGLEEEVDDFAAIGLIGEFTGEPF